MEFPGINSIPNRQHHRHRKCQPGLPIGTLINSSAHIEPYATDDNPSCNNSNWEVYTTGSFDPNDILVNEDTLTTTQLSNAPWLEYIIRFQNTGNDTAFTVKILNPIDTNKLNLSTLNLYQRIASRQPELDQLPAQHGV
jgi:hypothetical protein